MIKIYQSKKDNTIDEIKNLNKDTWINLINPSDKEIRKVADYLNIDDKLIKQVLVEKELPRLKRLDNATLIVINVPFMKDKSIKNKYITYPLGIIVTAKNITTVSLVEHTFLNNLEDVNTNKINQFDRNSRLFYNYMLIFIAKKINLG